MFFFLGPLQVVVGVFTKGVKNLVSMRNPVVVAGWLGGAGASATAFIPPLAAV